MKIYTIDLNSQILTPDGKPVPSSVPGIEGFITMRVLISAVWGGHALGDEKLNHEQRFKLGRNAVHVRSYKGQHIKMSESDVQQLKQRAASILVENMWLYQFVNLLDGKANFDGADEFSEA